MKNQKHILKLMVLLTINIVTARAQQQPIGINGHLFPARGKSMVTVATGIPYIGIAEYAYGISDRFSTGIIVGQTPKVAGYGLRIRGIIYHKNESFRLFVRAPILYYPKTKGLGGEPWFLTRPVISGEWKLDSGIRLSVGGVFVGAACANSLLGVVNDEHSHDVDVVPALEHDHDNETGFMGGLWNTFHAGIAVPVSKKIVFQLEVSVVMSGLKIAGKDWVGGPPVIVVLGFSYTL